MYRIGPSMRDESLRPGDAGVEDAGDRYRSLYDCAPVGLFSFDREGSILDVNMTGAALLGVERSHLVNKWFQLFVCQNSIPVFNAFCKSVFDTGTRQACEVGLLKKTRATLFVRIEGAQANAGQRSSMSRNGR